MLVGKRLKELRLEKGLTQRELGQQINVTKVSICCYENGTRTPTLETLSELEKFFQVDLNYLLGNDVKVKNKEKKEQEIFMSSEEITFIEELRKQETVYKRIMEDPKRCAELVGKKLR
ncbi:MAG TPA: helix-turn-helix transcriptional regulator [Candidatus Onthousia faecigallinarum]|nr:helix-turn-helix transcriptional regulator [Candidatus Onthousia faecigallinarum]